MGRSGKYAAHVAIAAIMASCVLSLAALGLWLWRNPLCGRHGEHAAAPAWPATGTFWASFGSLRVTIGYYIDSLTLAMFCMVTLVASCIHVYSAGYMHGELFDVVDALAPLSDGQPMRRRGRYCRFFQYLSLFCFSMLGLVVAGNAAMVFVFWELVGICSYLLIGFWRERKSASNAANKAFIVNRVGDFGMIDRSDGPVGQPGHVLIQRNLRARFARPAHEHQLQVPDGMARRRLRAAELTRHGIRRGTHDRFDVGR